MTKLHDFLEVYPLKAVIYSLCKFFSLASCYCNNQKATGKKNFLMGSGSSQYTYFCLIFQVKLMKLCIVNILYSVF